VRRALVVLLTLAALSSCATSERPEGIVERWLISLNQGAAGDPGTYAADELSQAVLPDWDELEPGQLDVIEVGRAREGPNGTVLVPFQVRYLVEDGEGAARAFAVVGPRAGSPRIIRLQPPPDSGPGVDPDFAARAGSSAAVPAWLAALGIAGLLILVTIGLMRLVPQPETQTGSST
jgi:hypothetical protein